MAIGDCAQWHGKVPGIMPVALAMGENAAKTLAGEPAAYQEPVLFTRFKGDGLDVVSVGTVAGPVVYRRRGTRYEAYFIEDSILKGAILIGSTEHLGFVRSHYLKTVEDSEVASLLAF